MTARNESTTFCESYPLRDDPEARARLLTDALATGQTIKIAVALFDIQQAMNGEVRKFDFGYNLRLDDLVEILKLAGLRLMAADSSTAAVAGSQRHLQ